MDKLEMALMLIQDAKDEKKRLAEFEEQKKHIPPFSDSNYWDAVVDLYKRFKPTPKKSIINDNLKMARRLLLAEYTK